jgi:AcrR family transcriptional regulator
VKRAKAPRTRRGQGARSRKRLLEVATALFTERGYGNTAVSQIARDADLPITSLYFHFGSKRDLLAAVIEDRTSRTRDELEIGVSANPDEAIDALVEQARERFDEHVAGLRLRVALTFEEHEESGDIVALALAGRARTEATLARTFTRLYADAGKSRAQRLGARLADVYLAGVQGICLEQLVRPRTQAELRWKFRLLADTLRFVARDALDR